MAKRGRPVGTTKEDVKTGVVHFRCDLAEKCKWVKQAQKEGKKLSAWIVGRLNK